MSKLYFENDVIKLFEGDNRTILPTLKDNSIGSIICDPPYEIGISIETENNLWDKSGIAYDVKIWKECLRVLKPGGFLIAFGFPKTYHHLASAIENAGFNIRDQIMWIFSSGYPKGMNLAKSIDRQKKYKGQIINVNKKVRMTNSWFHRVKHTTNILREFSPEAKKWDDWFTNLKPAHEPICLAQKPLNPNSYISNIKKWGVGTLNIGATRQLILANENNNNFYLDLKGRFPANILHDDSAEIYQAFNNDFYKFFYGSKASTADRTQGLEKRWSTKKELHSNIHQTIKPTEIMRWLIRLITPKGETILDPFLGSGSTGKAVLVENILNKKDYKFIGIEKIPAFMEIAKQRIIKGAENYIYEKTYKIIVKKDNENQMSLWKTKNK